MRPTSCTRHPGLIRRSRSSRSRRMASSGSPEGATSLQELTTVDADDRPGHVARLAGDQEANELRDALGFAVQVHRVGLQVAVLQVIDDRALKLRLPHAGRHAPAADAGARPTTRLE